MERWLGFSTRWLGAWRLEVRCRKHIFVPPWAWVTWLHPKAGMVANCNLFGGVAPAFFFNVYINYGFLRKDGEHCKTKIIQRTCFSVLSPPPSPVSLISRFFFFWGKEGKHTLAYWPWGVFRNPFEEKKGKPTLAYWSSRPQKWQFCLLKKFKKNSHLLLPGRPLTKKKILTPAQM